MRPSPTRLAGLMVSVLLLAACSHQAAEPGAESPRTAPASPFPRPSAPVIPTGPLPADLSADVHALVASVVAGGLSLTTLDRVVVGQDSRAAWVLADLLRFSSGSDAEALAAAFASLTGADPAADPTASLWVAATNQLIAWDLLAYAGYREHKATLFTGLDRRWAPFFDRDADLDWRLLSWGGVGIDDRPLGTTTMCELSCIPALDDPALVSARGGSWYPDDGVVLGIVVGDEAVALPRHLLQFREMVNLTLGGRRLGVPYCTLYNAAQAYVTEGATSP